MKKKLLVLVLSLTMVFTMTVPSFAGTDVWEQSQNTNRKYVAIGDSIGAGYFANGNWNGDFWESVFHFKEDGNVKNLKDSSFDNSDAYPSMVLSDTHANVQNSYNATYGGLRAQDFYYLLGGMGDDKSTDSRNYLSNEFTKCLLNSEDGLPVPDSTYGPTDMMSYFFNMALRNLISPNALDYLRNDANKTNLKNAVKNADMISVQLGSNDFTSLLVQNGGEPNDSLFEAFYRVGIKTAKLIEVIKEISDDGTIGTFVGQIAAILGADVTPVINDYLSITNTRWDDLNGDILFFSDEDLILDPNNNIDSVEDCNQARLEVILGLGGFIAEPFIIKGGITLTLTTQLISYVNEEYGPEAAEALAGVAKALKELDGITQTAVDNANEYLVKLLKQIRSINPGAKIVVTTMSNPIPTDIPDFGFIFDDSSSPMPGTIPFPYSKDTETAMESIAILLQDGLAGILQSYVNQVNDYIMDNGGKYNYCVADISEVKPGEIVDISELEKFMNGETDNVGGYWFHPDLDGQITIAEKIRDTFAESIENIPWVNPQPTGGYTGGSTGGSSAPSTPAPTASYKADVLPAIEYVNDRLAGDLTSDMYAYVDNAREKLEAAKKAVKGATLTAEQEAALKAAEEKVQTAEKKVAVMNSQVEGVKLVAGTGKVTLNWLEPNSDVAGYKVYRSATKKGTYKLVKTTTGKKFTNKKLKNGKRYYYKVKGFAKIDGQTVTTMASSAKSVKTK